MAAQTIELITYNILESGTVSISVSATSGYPATRLYDRSVNLLWQAPGIPGDRFGFDEDAFGFDDDAFGFVGEDTTITINQASSPKGIDTLWISNHNFVGLTLKWQQSADGNTWTTIIQWTATSSIQIKTLSSVVTQNYWRLAIEGDDNHQCGEIIMGRARSFNIQNVPDPMHSWIENVAWQMSVGGQERSIKYGLRRTKRAYTLRLTSADLVILQSALDDLNDFSRPFLIIDKDGDYYLMRFDPVPTEDYILNDRTEIDISLLEML